MKYTFTADAGHGWLRVSMVELYLLDIHEKITPYSYRKRDYAYLEEDCDVHTFLTAKVRNEPFTEWWVKNVTTRHCRRSHIRGYDHYTF